MTGDCGLLVARAVDWARQCLGSPDYRLRCLAFVEDCYEQANSIEIFGGDCARDSADLYGATAHQGVPPVGSFAFYSCSGDVGGRYRDWGHVGLAVGGGRVIHAWDVVREDDYLAVESLRPAPGWSRPQYLGWAPVDVVLCGHRRR